MLGANVQGQRIDATVHDGLQHIVYTNLGLENERVATQYTFEADVHWGPRLVHSFDAGGTTMRMVYGYAAHSGPAIAWPSAIVRGDVESSGVLDVTVWLIEDWSDTTDMSELGFHEPPMYLEVDFISSPDAPAARVRRPGYLDGVDPCSRLPIAVIHVIQSLGSVNRDADYNYDGTVDANDLVTVLLKFGPEE